MFYTWEENSILKLSDFEQNINDSLDDSIVAGLSNSKVSNLESYIES